MGAFWGKEEQGSGRSFRPNAETSQADFATTLGAPSTVTDAQLQELHIAVTATEEE